MASVFTFGLAFRGRTFCRYLCPVGLITRVYSFFSWLRPRGSSRMQGAMVVCPVSRSSGAPRVYCRYC
ncbi:MAG: 4Fe-4S binding protein [Thermoleophilia bacterium]